MVAHPASIAARARSNPVTLFLFDLLYLDGHDLRAIPLIERKMLLKSILKPGGVIRLSESFEAGEHLLDAAREQQLEGILAKRSHSPYRPRRIPPRVKSQTA